MRSHDSRKNYEEPELHPTLIRPLVELFLGVILLLLVASAFALAEPQHADSPKEIRTCLISSLYS